MKTWWVASCLGSLLPLCVACSGATEEGQDTNEVTGNDDEASNDADDGAMEDDNDDDTPNGVSDDTEEDDNDDDTPNGVSDDDGDDTEESDANASRAIPGVALMDDGENGDNGVLAEDEAGFVGYWYTFDDRHECDHPDFAEGNGAVCGSSVCAASGLTTPLPDPQGGTGFTMTEYEAVDAPAPPLEGEQTQNAYGVRLQGGGNKGWGAGVGVGFNVPGTLNPYDLAEQGFTALRFLARTATPGMQLKVKIKDAYSEPLGGKCLNRENYCDDVTTLTCTCAGSMSQGCHDDPSVILGSDPRFPAVSDAWVLYEIPLDAFSRGFWGKYLPGEEAPSAALDPTQAYQLQFEVQRPLTEETLPPFELWIDNVGFLTE